MFQQNKLSSILLTIIAFTTSSLSANIPSQQNSVDPFINSNEHGTFIEGDIRVSETKFQPRAKPILWSKRIIPYTLDKGFTKKELQMIKKRINDLHKMTCIRLKERTTEADYVAITNQKGCSSDWIGCRGGVQVITLGGAVGKCFNHEMFHALGFGHEQNRPDRDNYVTIMWKNIKSEYAANFYKRQPGHFTAEHMPYDFESVMHYRAKSFSKNNELTIVLKPKYSKYQNIIGQSKGNLSSLDIKKLNAVYKCPYN